MCYNLRSYSIYDLPSIFCRKGVTMKKRYIIGLILCCSLVLLTGVGCTKKQTTTNTSTLTPLQALNESIQSRFEAIWVVDNRQDSDLTNHANRIGVLETASTPIDLAPLTNRVSALESLNMSAISAQVSYFNLWIEDYDAENISDRLTVLEARFNSHINGSVTPTPTPNASSTPTPTPIVTPTGILTKPVAITPTVGNVSVQNGSIVFQWTECNASVYEFWFGSNSNSLVLIDTLESDVLSFLWPAPDSNTYYFWRVRAIVGTSVMSSSFWFKTQ